jgi:hypothetical protein
MSRTARGAESIAASGPLRADIMAFISHHNADQALSLDVANLWSGH